jgi:hypothetical protein
VIIGSRRAWRWGWLLAGVTLAGAWQPVKAVPVRAVPGLPGPGLAVPGLPVKAAPLPPVPGSPYPAGARGVDASFPQCPGQPLGPGTAFTVLGVNGGSAFTANPCLSRQWQNAPHSRSLYLNSGYDPSNDVRQTGACDALALGQSAPAADQNAYATGCAASQYSLSLLHQVGVGPPLVWWIDVEETNRWDPDVTVNRFALQGEIDQLVGSGRPIGVYSTAQQWRAIFGDWAPTHVSADWVPGVAAACAGPGFTGVPVWLIQDFDPGPGGLDSDWAC